MRNFYFPFNLFVSCMKLICIFIFSFHCWLFFVFYIEFSLFLFLVWFLFLFLAVLNFNDATFFCTTWYGTSNENAKKNARKMYICMKNNSSSGSSSSGGWWWKWVRSLIVWTRLCFSARQRHSCTRPWWYVEKIIQQFKLLHWFIRLFID